MITYVLVLMYYVTSLRDDTYSSKAALEILRM
jgi:hypothetical protein